MSEKERNRLLAWLAREYRRGLLSFEEYRAECEAVEEAYQ